MIDGTDKVQNYIQRARLPVVVMETSLMLFRWTVMKVVIK